MIGISYTRGRERHGDIAVSALLQRTHLSRIESDGVLVVEDGK